MKYNPERHSRRSIRLKGYDYSQNGAYFITISTHNSQSYFERHPRLRQIVAQQWQEISNRFADVTLDEFIVMPNHIHGIIIVGATLAVAQNCIAQNNRAGARPAPTIGEIVGTFKSLCVQDWLRYIKTGLMQLANSGNVIIMNISSVTRKN